MKFGELGQHISENPACAVAADVILLKNDATVRTMRKNSTRRTSVYDFFFNFQRLKKKFPHTYIVDARKAPTSSLIRTRVEKTCLLNTSKE